MFHYGHIESFRKCKELYPKVTLIVGIISDSVAANYKRTPIYPEHQRYALVKNSKYVDETITDSPLVITEDFMTKYSIDLVVHGFVNQEDQEKQDTFFQFPKSINKFRTIDYCQEVSTTYILQKIKNIYGNAL